MSISTVEERTTGLRMILRNSEDHPVLVDAKTACLAFMEEGLDFISACYNCRAEPSVFREMRRLDEAFDHMVKSLEQKIAERDERLRIKAVAPGSDVPLPVDNWDSVSDVIGRDPDLQLNIPGNWKRLFLRHYASTLRRVESLDMSGTSAADFIIATDPDCDEFDVEFTAEIQEIELRYTLALEDRQRARAISTGADGSIKLAMSGLDNKIARKYAEKKAPILIDKRIQTSITVSRESADAADPIEGLRRLAEMASGPRRLTSPSE